MSEPIWKKFVAKLGIVLIIVFAAIFGIIIITEKSCNEVSEIAEKFKTGKVTTEFREYVTGIKGLQRFQVASLKSVATFSREDTKNYVWGFSPDFKVKIEISLPVEYNYYLDFKDKWSFEWDDSLMSVKVIAPNLKPNTPAVDVSNMKINVLEGSIFRDEDAVKDSLIVKVMDKLVQEANQNIPLIRESARQAVSSFISDWFMQFLFKDYETKPKSISVFFEDEVNLIEMNKSFKINQNLD